MEDVWRFLLHNPGFTLIGAFTLIQIVPIKINPWSWVAKVIHKWLFGEIDRKLDAISDKVDKLERQAEEKDAVQARTHILRFADELYNNIDHSKEYFDDIITMDIDGYENYCKEHEKFRNGKTTASIQLIKDTYARLLAEHKFL